jgi:hypothetical protein
MALGLEFKGFGRVAVFIAGCAFCSFCFFALFSLFFADRFC